MSYKGRESIARIERHSQIKEERPAKRYISKPSISGRYLWERSVTIPRWSITHGNTVFGRHAHLLLPSLSPSGLPLSILGHDAT
jgi:hypothetical protein